MLASRVHTADQGFPSGFPMPRGSSP